MAQTEKDELKKQLNEGAKQIGAGIWLLVGQCNSAVVDQPDGIVVIEGPYSSFYGELIINKAKELFPGKRIKALITTSDAWLHIGGVRAFAAIPGIKIYHPARNRFILEKLLKANYKTDPDKLAKTAKPSYTLTGVTDTMTVGNGDNRLDIYAYRTETGDRQMMVYFPQRKLLYTSDHYQPKDGSGTYWNSEIVWEVYHSIKERKLDVKYFYAMHSAGLIPFEDMTNDVQKGME
jgi:glyoxylase-like metal-dependent hydrolase (beta-lactamase superfamily II)